MTTAADILTTARSRANEGTPYAGAVTPQEAYDLLQGDAAVNESHLRAVAGPALRHRLRRNPLDDAGSGTRVARAVAELLPA